MTIERPAKVEEPGFSAAFRDDGGETVIELTGEIDIAAAPSLREFLVLALGSSEPRVHVDLSQVRFLDSSGVGQLVQCCKQARSRGGSFSVACGSSPVRRILEIEGLLEFFCIRDLEP
jgi:anti-sigma B factor antagonist